MEEKVSNFVEKCIAKNAFHKKEKPKPIKVDKVEIKRIVLSEKKAHMVKRDHLNILYNIEMKLILSQHNYA